MRQSNHRRTPVRLLALFLPLLSAVLLAQEVPPPAPPSAPPQGKPGYVLVDDMWIPVDALHGEGAYIGSPWPSGNVRIAFESAISSSRRDLFRKAMWEIESIANIDFFEVSPSYSGDFILVQINSGFPNVSSSAVGIQGGEQDLFVGANHWDVKYVLVHELFHALGYKHEQSRPDRVFYVGINYNNISQTACNGGSCDSNFDIDGGITAFGPYNFESIMHYSSTAFGNGQTTIVALPPYQASQSLMGNRNHLTNGDADMIQNWYGQPSSPQIGYCTPSAVEAGSFSNLEIEVGGGSWFHEGSEDGLGILGTRVRFNGTILETTFINQTTLRAIIPSSLLQTPGTYQVDVTNHSNAGGVSPSSVNFIVLPPPCVTQGDRVGGAVVGLGDVNADGAGDYAVGMPGVSSNRGRVRVYSGKTGATIWTVDGPSSGDLYGFALSTTGDVNGDGRRELLIGAPGANNTGGQFDLRSGLNGAILATVGSGAFSDDFGQSVAGVGDIDGDGDQDWLVGALGNAGLGRVEVWSAAGGLIRTHTSGVASDSFGWSVGGGYDLNYDGRPDYVVGAPDWNNGTTSDVGRVHVYNGASGALLVTKTGDGQYDRFGFSVAMTLGTQSQSGLGNIVVGAPEIPNLFSGTGNGNGYARVFGPAIIFGTSYQELATYTGAGLGDRFGLCVREAGDANDDGYADILVGAPQSTLLNANVGPGYFEIRSGLTDGVLYRHVAQSADEQLGWSVALVGDTNDDTRFDYVVGVPGSDVGCIDAGGYRVVKPPVAPEYAKLMITEVSTGNPDCVEITNFGTTNASLSTLTIRWKDSTVYNSSALSGSLPPGHILVVHEPTNPPAEMPGNVLAQAALPSIPTTVSDIAVALIGAGGQILDEVHLESSAGTYAEGSLGGKFRGYVRHELTQAGEVNAERIWGLDSNSGGDWTTGRPRSMGLENSAGGTRGYDPIGITRVRINEIDDSPDFIELLRPTSFVFAAPALNLENWYFLMSALNGSAHSKVAPFTTVRNLATGGFVVVGDTSTPPSGMPGNVPYLYQGGNIPFIAEEFSCALYDSYGRCVDLVRSEGASHPIVHNHPRAPAHWSEFTGVASRSNILAAAVARNQSSTDTNTGGDFVGSSFSTFGLANPLTHTPTGTTGLDVRLNATPYGTGITAIINAGPEHAGEKWSFTFSYGHILGAGPILGLNSEAVNHWLTISMTPPFTGVLDQFGCARLDFPTASLPPGVDTDDLFLTQANDGNPLSPIVLLSPILEFDT